MSLRSRKFVNREENPIHGIQCVPFYKQYPLTNMALFMKCSLNAKKNIFIPFRANSFTTVLTLTTGKSLFLCLSGHLFSVTFTEQWIYDFVLDFGSCSFVFQAAFYKASVEQCYWGSFTLPGLGNSLFSHTAVQVLVSKDFFKCHILLPFCSSLWHSQIYIIYI